MITQVITDLPTPPQSSDVTNFRTRADSFVSALDLMQGQLNTFATQANALEENVNEKEESTATAALAAASAAASAANFKGEWSSASSYAIGDSVIYSSIIYRAILSGSNKQPNLQPTYWAALSVASAIAFTPSGGLSSVTVQNALIELDTEKAPLSSPTFTGTPTAPTPSQSDNSKKIPTTEWVNGLFATGSYTPGISSITNATISPLPSEFKYQKIRNSVNVYGSIVIDPIAAGQVSFQTTVPIPSNFVEEHEASGTFFTSGAQQGGTISASIAGDTLSFNMNASITTSQTYRFSATYLIRTP